MCKGFKQISNDFFESGYWRQSRTYNDCEAVLDIISQVRFEASEHTARIGGREVTWGQAEWPASVRFLAQRWKWTERRVRTFMSSLKKQGVIDVSDTQGVSIIRLKRYLVLADTANDTQNDTPNSLNMSALVKQVTQLVTQQMTQQITSATPERHSTDTKHNNGDNIIDSSLRSESTHTNSACGKFDIWLSEHCPYIFKHYKLLSDAEFEKLKAQYGSEAIANECENIENRVDLRKKYSNLYRTLLNWLKRRYIERNETTTTSGRRTSSAPTDQQLIFDTYDLISEARTRETVDDL